MWALGQRQYANANTGSGFEDDPAPHVKKLTHYAAPTGLAFLVLATFLSASAWVCTEECVRTSDSLEDRLLECMDRCEVKEPKQCQRMCKEKIGFSRREVDHREVQCQRDCVGHPGLIRFLTVLGVFFILPVSPIVGSYPGSCKCDCCIGAGCNPRLALYCISWTAYAFSCLWLLPSLLEKPHQVGGKALFAVCQVISMAAMVGSRRVAQNESKSFPGSVVGGPTQHGGHPVGVMVGQPVHGPSNLDLQQQVTQLQHQVRELTRLATGSGCSVDECGHAQATAYHPPLGGMVVAGLPVASPQELQQLQPSLPPKELM